MSDDPKAVAAFMANVTEGKPEMVMNGLAEALGFNPFGLPQGPGAWMGGEQISDASTIFKNLRWYLISNMRQPLSQAYAEIGLIQTITDVPVDDALRGGLEIKSKQLDPDDISELHAAMEDADDLEVLSEAGKWNRLFGGAGVIAMTDQNPSKPLRDIKKGEALEFRAADLWELLFNVAQGAELDQAMQIVDVDYFQYYGINLHRSRVSTMKGVKAPSFIRPRLRGWGMSVVEVLVRSINQYLKGTDLTFEVLDEFKVDVYKLKNLAAAIASNQQDKVLKRVQLANMQKNYQRAVVIDGEEDWDHKQLSFSGLAEAGAGIRMQVASDLRMPLTKIFGVSAAGFNSGEDDIEVYNGMVEGQVRSRLRRPARDMVKMRCMQLFGFVPSDLKVGFRPLRVLSQEQEENVKTQKYTRLQGAASSGLITAEEFRDASNRGGLFDIELDPDAAPSPEDVATGSGGGDDDSAGGAKAKGVRGGKVSKEDRDLAKEAPKAPDVENSAGFNRAAYEADGGDSWIDSRRREFFSPEKAKDKALWAAAEQASRDAFGEMRWQFAVWFYEKQGGKF